MPKISGSHFFYESSAGTASRGLGFLPRFLPGGLSAAGAAGVSCFLSVARSVAS